MKKLTVAVAVFLALGAATWFGYFAPEAVARRLVGPSLFDAPSAKFRNLRSNKLFLCGEVNAKNQFGGYVGFRPFAAVPKHGPSSVRLATARESNRDFPDFCYGD